MDHIQLPNNYDSRILTCVNTCFDEIIKMMVSKDMNPHELFLCLSGIIQRGVSDFGLNPRMKATLLIALSAHYLKVAQEFIAINSSTGISKKDGEIFSKIFENFKDFNIDTDNLHYGYEMSKLKVENRIN